MGSFWAVLGPSGAVLGLPWAILGGLDRHRALLGISGLHPGALLCASWSSLGLSWGPSGSSSDHLWALFGLSWGPLGTLSGCLGALWDRLGALLGRIGALLEAFWPVVAVSQKWPEHNCFFNDVGLPGLLCEASRGHLKASWTMSEPSWTVLRAWTVCGPSWESLGALLGLSCVHLGAILGLS